MPGIIREKMYANALNQSFELGPIRLGRLREYFGSFAKTWGAPIQELKNAAEMKGLEEFRNKIDPEKEFSDLEKYGIKILLREEFPESLLETPFPPAILYIKGELPGKNFNYLAVVGTRKYTTYGKEACEKIVAELKDYDFVIVSGLALGIDAIAHKAALKNKIRTIAVLGCGLKNDVIYPPANKKLAEEISENGGAVVSEYPFSMKAQRFTFQQRNRIVTGLSRGVFVVEAPEKSGALITANFAVDYNRDVFSLPGPIFSANSGGTNKLLKNGAAPVVCGNDILEAYGIEPKTDKTAGASLSPIEEKIISALTEPASRDELIRKIGLPAREVNPALGILEIRGIIKETGGEIFKL